jgi:hypothetical protein
LTAIRVDSNRQFRLCDVVVYNGGSERRENTEKEAEDETHSRIVRPLEANKVAKTPLSRATFVWKNEPSDQEVVNSLSAKLRLAPPCVLCVHVAKS